jgi:hypothetical protein
LRRFGYSLCLLAIALPTAHAVVIRDDVPDARYLATPAEFPALVDLPNEGQGTLIAKQWVVTAAHAVRWGKPDHVVILGRSCAVSALIVYPGFKMPEQAVMAGDPKPLMAQFAAMNDIALLKLAEPVTDVAPVALYRTADELGKVVRIYGKGATGNGLVGQYKNSPHRGKLRRADNVITSANGKWLAYRFDQGKDAQPLEGQLGDGDSGGPVLIRVRGQWQLAGLADWKSWQGDLAKFQPGIYGQTTYQVRVSYFAPWIDAVIAGTP